MSEEAYEWSERGYLTREEAHKLPAEQVRKAVIRFMDDNPVLSTWIRLRKYVVSCGIVGAAIIGEYYQPAQMIGEKSGIIGESLVTNEVVTRKELSEKMDIAIVEINKVQSNVSLLKHVVWTKRDAWEAYNELTRRGVSEANGVVEKVLLSREIRESH